MTRINTNVSSLIGRNTLGRSNASLNEALTRLSTGLRINTGKDDPAGLIASENLRSDITAIRKAISNTDRANQVIATADSALGQVSSLLNDIRGLVTESANAGALSDDQIAANQLQVDSSLEALNRIAQTTTFQGRKLLDGSLDFITSAGTGFTNLSDLKIDQANLGATGSVSVDISVSAAATQAQVDVANIPNTQTAAQGTLDLDIITTQGIASDGDVTFSVISTEAVGATGSTTITAGTGVAASQSGSGAGGNAITLASDPVIEIDAVAGEALDGLAGNLTIDLIDDGGLGVGTSPTVVLNGSTLEITAEDGVTTGQNIIDAINAFNTGGGAADLNASLSGGTGTNTFATADATGAGDGALTGGTQATDTAVLNIVAQGGNLASSVTVDINFGGGNGTGIVVSGSGASGGTLTVTLEDNIDITLDDIATALQNNADVETASFASNGTLTVNSSTGGAAGTGDAAPANATVSGGTDESTENVVINVAGDLVSGVSGNVELEFATASIAAGTTNVVANGVNGSGQNRYIIQLSDQGDVALSAITTAIASISEVDSATVQGTPTVTAISTFDADSDPDGIDTLASTVTLGNGVTEVVTSESIDIDAEPGGLNNINIAVSFADLSGVGTAIVGDATSGYTLQIDTTANVSLANITARLETLSEVNSASVTSGGTGSYQTAITSSQAVPTAVQLQGGADNGITDDLVIEVAGAIGTEVLSFQAGTSITQLINGINLVSDATGVGAAESSTTTGTLEFTSTEYGSNSVVDLKVISEGSSTGVFSTAIGSGARETGVDVIASVNGVSATGNGNSLSINTATLDLGTTVAAGITGTISFEITGGGALFQLGPDVVSNQQARLGIGSVNTARLGGLEGKLFQLGTGGTSSLTADPNAGAKIVEAAIDQVTGLRGRLGAFQRTTLETNKNALNDTLVNLSEAESSIRDADFAVESAKLTRAQILVQSGTNVLSIANQNPQNVLALLR